MFLKRKVRPIVMILVVVFILAAGLMATTYFTGTSESSVEAFTGLDSYTVKTGDSLFSIAAKYGVSLVDLKQINSLGTDKVTPGQVLTIPNKPAKDSNWYTVRNTDSLYLIATKYGLTVNALKQINNLTSDLIVPGQVLAIPKTTSSQPPAKQEPVAPPITKKTPVPTSPAEQPLKSDPEDRSLAEVLKEKGITDPWSKMAIIVDKSNHTLSLFAGGVWLKSYSVELGDSGSEDKQVQGDHKTPEGTFYIAEKSILEPSDEFLGTRWMRLSYPNIEDAKRGVQQGLIDQQTHDQIVTAFNNKSIPPQRTALGGGVGIHGGSTPALGSNWTWGCVGLTNRNVEDFYNFVTVGTPVIIQQ